MNTSDFGTQSAADRSIYLHQGDLAVSREPATIVTVLGSCVAVCLWDPSTATGGMNHFLLPEWRGGEAPSPRFGNVAINDLVEAMVAKGAARRNLQAMIFGGAIVLDSQRNLDPVGSQNIAVAFRMLAIENIPVQRNEVGGQRGRRITFETASAKITSKVV